MNNTKYQLQNFQLLMQNLDISAQNFENGSAEFQFFGCRIPQGSELHQVMHSTEQFTCVVSVSYTPQKTLLINQNSLFAVNVNEIKLNSS